MASLTESFREAVPYLLSRLQGFIKTPGELGRILIRIYQIYKAQGWVGVRQGFRRDRIVSRAEGLLPVGNSTRNYQEWIDTHEKKSAPKSSGAQETGRLPSPLISLVLPVGASSGDPLRQTVDSLLQQENRQWELWLCGELPSSVEGSVELLHWQSEQRVKFVDQTISQPLPALVLALRVEMAGDYCICLQPGDILPVHALAEVALRLAETPEAVIFYTDEDRIDSTGKRHDPFFKPDLNPLLLAGSIYFGGLAGYKTSYLRHLAGGGEEVADAYPRRLALQVLRDGPATAILHIPGILCHRHDEAGPRQADKSLPPPLPLPDPPPLVSLIIPTRNGQEMLRRCLDSIEAKTDYANYEVLIVDNQSNEPASLDYLRTLALRPKFRVLPYDAPFNYAAINNVAARQAAGELLCFLNNDVEVISGCWLTEMVSLALQPESGAVGAMLYFPDDTIQHAGIALGMSASGVGGVAKNAFCGLPRGFAGQGGRLRFPQNVSAVTGACMVLRRSVFEAVGGFDEVNLPVTFNDVDLCLRLMEKGYRNVFTPQAELYHHESSSRGQDDSAAKRARFSREVIYMRRRWARRLAYDPYFPSELSTWGWV